MCRNIYEGLDLLHSLRISHPLTNKVFSYMWCKTEDGSIGSVKLIGANGSMQTMTKHNNTVSRERDERAGVLHFLEKLRIAECPDYPSFRWLVENRYETFYSCTLVAFKLDAQYFKIIMKEGKRQLEIIWSMKLLQ